MEPKAAALPPSPSIASLKVGTTPPPTISRQTSELSLARRGSTLNIPNLKEKSSGRIGSISQGLTTFTNAHLKQTYTAQARKSLNTFSSVNYSPSHSELYLNWLRGQGKSRRGWEIDRWFLLMVVGILTGLVAALLAQCIQALSEFRWEGTKRFAHEGNIPRSFGHASGVAIFYVIISSFLIVFIHPPAAGGGTPDVIGYLNGVVVHNVFSIKNLIVKFLSNVFAVCSGLPCAIQGPIITYGAIIGMGVGQFQSKTLKCAPKVFRRFRNAEDRRAFTTAGVAAGVSAAFNAPIGGLMFAMEDISSFWSKSLSWQVFFTAVIAQATAGLFKTAFQAFHYRGAFGLFSLSTTEPLQVYVAAIPVAIVLGILGGLLGALFTVVNVRVTCHIRKKVMVCLKVGLIQKLAKIFECVLLVMIMALFYTVLPQAFGCSPLQLDANHTRFLKSCYLISMNQTLPFKLETYSCPEGNETYYNEVATVIQNGGPAILKILWSRSTHYLLSARACMTILAFWFPTTCWAAGMSFAGGIFVPTLVTGSLYGRTLGIGILTIWTNYHPGQYIPINTGSWDWIDPGLMAAIGAGSLLGGVTRLSLASTVIVTEMAQDINLIIPMFVAVSVAKVVANLLCKPLWKYQMEGKSLPFLDQEPEVVVQGFRVNLEMFKARDVMASDVSTIRATESVGELSAMLVSTRHEGFPVVKRDPESGYDVMFGLLTRTELLAILYNEGEFLENRPGAVIRPEVPYETVSVDYVADPSAAEERVRCYTKFDAYRQIYIDLEHYVNDSAPKVDADYSLHRTYNVFRTLGLRHLVVVDLVNRVVGMITRKDLMAFRIAERLNDLPTNTSDSATDLDEMDNGAFDTLLPAITKRPNGYVETVHEVDEEYEYEDDEEAQITQHSNENGDIPTVSAGIADTKEYDIKVEIPDVKPNALPIQDEKPSPSLIQDEKPSPSLIQDEKPSPLLIQDEKQTPLLNQDEKPSPLPIQDEKPNPLHIQHEGDTTNVIEHQELGDPANTLHIQTGDSSAGDKGTF